MPVKFDAVLILILFIIPGFISQYLIGSSIPRRQQGTNEVILEALLFSCINYAVLGWPLLLLPSLYPAFIATHAALMLIAWLIVLFVAPVGWGLLFSWLIQHQKFTGLYSLLGLRYTDPMPRAWDYYFSQGRQGWVRVTLTDGTMIGAFMGTASFASSFPSLEDLYLETVYEVDERGIFAPEPIPNSGGVWIQGNQIKFIEFIALPEGEIDHGGTEAN